MIDDIYNKLLIEISEEKIKFDKNKLYVICEYAIEKYGNKKRYSNITLLEHSLGVASEVIKMKLDEETIYASILHEIVNLDDYNRKEIENENKISKEVLDMIEAIAKLNCLNYGSKENKDVETFRKMFLAIAKDIRTVIIKLIDRLYNMRNINEYNSQIYRENMAKESLYIYSPIAHRLGMSQLKSELEDISFRILYKEEYQEIKKQIDEKKKDREEYIKNRIEEINENLKKEGINATVYGRPKHFYSIYKKMKKKGCMVDDLFDLLAIRIIVDSIKDCYSALGLVHFMYKPLPGRFKDYIAVPKTNMYQSLHTTVFGEGGKPFEIQIRTWDMHKIADYGIAAHFAYKEKRQKQDDVDKKIVWLRQMLEMQQDIANNEENIAKIKSELLGEEVFVFTPKGDIFSLPKGSTTVDFAYMIHQKIAEKMVGVKINSKMVPISTKLQNTDIVEIVTHETAKAPSIDWLKFVKTSNARNKITSYLKKQNKEENILKGKEMFEKEIKRLSIPKEFVQNDKNISEMLKRNFFNSLEECYENIGFGSITPKKVLHKLVELYNQLNTSKIIEGTTSRKKKTNRNQNLVKVKNIDNCLIKFARCCNPIPGDKIVGYITHSNGVSIHREDCKNLNGIDISNRRIDVDWQEKVLADFETKIVIHANTSENVLADVILGLKELKINVKDINVKNTLDRETIINLTISIPNNNMLQTVFKRLRKIDSVYDVKRGK